MWAPNSGTGSTKEAASLPRVEAPWQDTALLKKRPYLGAKDSRSIFLLLVLSNQFDHYTIIHFVSVSNGNSETVLIVQNQNIYFVSAPTSETYNVSVKHSKNLLGFSSDPLRVLWGSFWAPFGFLLSSS